MLGDKIYFEDLGVDVSECKNINEVLNKSKLNFTVNKENIYLKNGKQIKNNFATVRNDTKSILGIVGKDYTILNNFEGFDFVDNLIENYNIRFVKAGEWNKNERSFIILKMQEQDLNGDKLIPYILLTNCYDGSGSIKAILTPVIDNNVIMFDDYKYLIRHSKNVKDRPILCENLIQFFNSALESIRYKAELFIKKDFTLNEFSNALNIILGVNKNISNIKRERAEQTINEIINRYNSEENSKFSENLWRAVLSVAGQECQRKTLRETGNSEIFLYRVLNEMKFLNQFLKETN